MLLLNFAVLIFLTFANAANIAPKISNGQDAEITEFPFLISIQEIDVHVCVASLLNERWALSAARCFNTRSLRDLNIEFGFSVITPGPSGENKATISQIVMHEDFITSPLSNDIALIELSSPIVTGFHEPFARLVISGGSRFRAGTTAAHAGWGHVRQNVRTNILQKGEVFVMTSEQCEEFQRSARQICAKGDSVICTADLGEQYELILSNLI